SRSSAGAPGTSRTWRRMSAKGSSLSRATSKLSHTPCGGWHSSQKWGRDSERRPSSEARRGRRGRPPRNASSPRFANAWRDIAARTSRGRSEVRARGDRAPASPQEERPSGAVGRPEGASAKEERRDADRQTRRDRQVSRQQG